MLFDAIKCQKKWTILYHSQLSKVIYSKLSNVSCAQISQPWHTVLSIPSATLTFLKQKDLHGRSGALKLYTQNMLQIRNGKLQKQLQVM